MQLSLGSALMGALIFAFHPAHIEAVVPVYNYMGLLASFFALGSFFLWVKFRDGKKRRFAILAVIFFALAVFSKEDTLVLPALILAYDMIFKTCEKKIAWQDFVPWIAVAAVYLIMRMLFVERGASLGLWAIENDFNIVPAAGLTEKMRSVIQVYAEYLRMLVWPKTQTPFHSLAAFSFLKTLSWLQVFIWIVWIGSAWILRKEKVVLFSFFWFLITLFLVSNLIPIGGLFAERLVYLPSAAYAFFAAWVFERFFQLGVRRSLLFSGMGVVLLAYAVRVWIYIPVWKNDITLWEYASARAPDRPLPRLNLAEAYFEQRDYEKAAQNYLVFLSFPQKPIKEAMIRHKLSRAWGELGQYQLAADELKKVIATMPSNSQAYFDLGWTYFLQGKNAAAREVFSLLRVRQPENPWGAYGLAEVAANEEKTMESRQFYVEALNRSTDPGLRETILKKLQKSS